VLIERSFDKNNITFIIKMDRLGAHYTRYSGNPFAEWNTTEFEHQSYTNAHSADANNKLSIAQEPDILYEKQVHYLAISSKDRDVVAYPDVNHYVIHLPREFKNIHSIELVQAIIPDQQSVTDEPYLLLKIAEIEDVMASNDRGISDAFAILQLAPPTTTGGFIQIDKRIHENVVKFFHTPKSSLSKMTITITDESSIPFDFGADGPNPPMKNLQNTFVFKITCLEKKRDQIQHRNVF
jgi:hypothetical protein